MQRRRPAFLINRSEAEARLLQEVAATS